MELDMSAEKAPSRKKLLQEGTREFEILSAREQKSKSGNNMIVFNIKDIQTGYTEDIYAVAEPKKRWFLKQILEAVGCPAVDGIYKVELPDLIGKKFAGTVEHEENEYINRDGVTVKGKQHKIVDVNSTTELEWDRDIK